MAQPLNHPGTTLPVLHYPPVHRLYHHVAVLHAASSAVRTGSFRAWEENPWGVGYHSRHEIPLVPRELHKDTLLLGMTSLWTRLVYSFRELG